MMNTMIGQSQRSEQQKEETRTNMKIRKVKGSLDFFINSHLEIFSTSRNFPVNGEMRSKWQKAIRREGFTPTMYSKVCSEHFTEDCFDRAKFGARWLKASAVPTKFDFSSDGKGSRRGRSLRPKKLLAALGANEEMELPVKCKTNSARNIVGKNYPSKASVDEVNRFRRSLVPMPPHGASGKDCPSVPSSPLSEERLETPSVKTDLCDPASGDPFSDEVRLKEVDKEEEITENDSVLETSLVEESKVTAVTPSTQPGTWVVCGDKGEEGHLVTVVIQEADDDSSISGTDGSSMMMDFENYSNMYLEEEEEEEGKDDPIAVANYANNNDREEVDHNQFKRECYRYLGDFTEEDMLSPVKARKAFRLAVTRLAEKNKLVRLLRQDKRRLQKRVNTLKAMLEEVLSDIKENHHKIYQEPS